MQRNVSIEHFLNTKLKPVAYLSGKFYPLFLTIHLDGKKIQIKSRINEHLKIYSSNLERLTEGDKQIALLFNSGLFSQQWLTTITRGKKFPVYPLMADEINVLKRIIELRLANNNKSTLSKIGLYYENYIKEITDIIDDHIKSAFQEELKTLFLNTIDDYEKKDIFKIANYFIHYINWNHPFYNVYDSTSEVMAGELKKIESHLSKDLRLSVKAYTAFYNYINPLKRFFEKREQGRIATLSYLDWNSDIKTLLARQFVTMLGKKAAAQYIRRLDEILSQCLGSEA
jgi:hypothetical protein